MKFKNLVWSITAEDIFTLTKLIDKINIKNIKIDKEILITGIYKVIGLNVEFEGKIELINVQNNSIHLKLESFNIAKMNNTNSIVKKTLDYLINSITSARGITFDRNIFKIDIEAIVHEYLEKENRIKLNNLYVEKVFTVNNEVQFFIQHVDFTMNNII